MAFTVNHNSAHTKDAEFEAYARLLRQRGIDLGKVPRTPDPTTGRRWLYVWNSRDEAQRFSDELRKRTGDDAWSVAEIILAPPSEGPMGPIIIQVGRRSTGLVLALQPLSRIMIHSAFPSARSTVTTVSIDSETLDDFQRTHGSMAELAREIAPSLTGLNSQELEQVGYALIEDDSDRTLVFVPPGDLVQAKLISA